ncbi:hypothetical protein BDD43_5216 [Mucilaginibacter gracilis]|uniref:Uncharacterized protein n=1 Tax=Mucilaginibacter gracilis TaxID=423350 RepID=A0A495J9A0_9SPHI|nr:hypothetical protein BDD43_5216 [Mucilaginibacter gracilis]
MSVKLFWIWDVRFGNYLDFRFRMFDFGVICFDLGIFLILGFAFPSVSLRGTKQPLALQSGFADWLCLRAVASYLAMTFFYSNNEWKNANPKIKKNPKSTNNSEIEHPKSKIKIIPKSNIPNPKSKNFSQINKYAVRVIGAYAIVYAEVGVGEFVYFEAQAGAGGGYKFGHVGNYVAGVAF